MAIYKLSKDAITKLAGTTFADRGVTPHLAAAVAKAEAGT